ncbi:MAG: threonine--tRNA ligase, partial [Acidobacteria bacterium]|nr:threonine--tRNA ligase [Acidobacteriota bacterium]
EQARVLPVSDKFIDAARAVGAALVAAGLRAEVDDRNEKLGARIRDGELARVPVLLVVGGREAQAGGASVRVRHRGDLGTMTLDTIIEAMKATIATRDVNPWPEAS